MLGKVVRERSTHSTRKTTTEDYSVVVSTIGKLGQSSQYRGYAREGRGELPRNRGWIVRR